MVVGATPQGPAIPALIFSNRQVIDAGDSQPHQAVFVELPVFIAVTAIPMTAVVMPLVCKTHGYPVFAKSPQFLDQPVVEFARPLAREKRLDGIASLEEFGAIAPAAVRGIGKRNPNRIARVPSVLRQACLLGGGFQGKRGQRRSVHRIPRANVSAEWLPATLCRRRAGHRRNKRAAPNRDQDRCGLPAAAVRPDRYRSPRPT